MGSVQLTRRNNVATIVLDRPNVINAIDLPMFEAIGRALAGWRSDPQVEAVVIRGNGRAFSAGGDIAAVRRAALAGDAAHNDRLYRTEYSLNALIANYPKPYVALMHGYCLGGGLGLAMHGSHRVVAADTLIAMPETAIGFFPDVGASYVFARLRGGLGQYLGLTGTRLNAAEASLGAVADAIVDSASIGPALVRYASAPANPGHDSEPAIDRCFSASSLLDIVARLEDERSAWATAAYERLRSASPTALALTFTLIARAASLDLSTSLRIEYELAKRMWRRREFLEGVRAMVVDKDRRPAWQPARLEDVDFAAVDALLDEATACATHNIDPTDSVDERLFA